MTEHHELISAHLDGELSDAEGEHVRRSVAEDPSLARHAEELAKVRSFVRDLPPVDPPFGVLERMVLDLRRFRPSRTMVSATWGAAAAAVVRIQRRVWVPVSCSRNSSRRAARSCRRARVQWP